MLQISTYKLAVNIALYYELVVMFYMKKEKKTKEPKIFYSIVKWASPVHFVMVSFAF